MDKASSLENINHNAKKRPILISVLLSVAFSFNIFVFAPLDSYFSGKSEFWFTPSSIITAVLICFTASLAVCLCITLLLPKKVAPFVMSLLLSAMVGLYVQGNYLMHGYPILDGKPINWDSMVQKAVINTIIWAAIFIIPFIVMLFKRKIFFNTAKFVSVIILGLEIVTLVVSVVMPSQNFDLNNTSCYLTADKQFDMSENENIIVIVSDAFESRYLTRALEEIPEIKEQLADFTFYSNTSGVSITTNLSLPTLLTGEVIPLGMDAKQGMLDCFQKTDFYDIMHQNNYKVNVYTDSSYMNSAFIGKVDNLVPEHWVSGTNTKVNNALSETMYRYTFFRYMPHLLKQYFVLDTQQFNEPLEYIDQNVYSLNDIGFNSKILNEGVLKSEENNVFALYHLAGPHPPAVLNRNVEPVEWSKDVTEVDKRYEQALAQITILNNLTASLKETGTYDNTTIVFTADHGDSIFLNPVFMIKPAHEQSDFKFSKAPISVAADLIPFIEEIAQGKGRDAALYNIPEDSKRERYAYNLMTNEKLYDGVISCRSVIAVDGPANELASYKPYRDEFYEKEPKNKYKLGSKIRFSGLADNAYINGVYDELRRAYSGTAVVKVTVDEPKPISTDIIGRIKIDEIFGDKQQLEIYSGEQLICSETITDVSQDVVFTIANNLIKDNLIDITLVFPDNFTLYGNDCNAYNSFVFDSISFEK